MDWNLATLPRGGVFSRRAPAATHTSVSVLYVFQAFDVSCVREGLGGDMDLGGNWALEEGSWLSHTGDRHFPNTRGGMATFPLPIVVVSPFLPFTVPVCLRCLRAQSCWLSG